MKDKEILKTIGSNIRKIREMRGLSQQQLAIKAGHDSASARSWISKIESGARSTYTNELAAIAVALDVPPSFLYIEFENNTTNLEERILAYSVLINDMQSKTPISEG